MGATSAANKLPLQLLTLLLTHSGEDDNEVNVDKEHSDVTDEGKNLANQNGFSSVNYALNVYINSTY